MNPDRRCDQPCRSAGLVFRLCSAYREETSLIQCIISDSILSYPSTSPHSKLLHPNTVASQCSVGNKQGTQILYAAALRCTAAGCGGGYSSPTKRWPVTRCVLPPAHQFVGEEEPSVHDRIAFAEGLCASLMQAGRSSRGRAGIVARSTVTLLSALASRVGILMTLYITHNDWEIFGLWMSQESQNG
jgi:hypothetical protein